MDIIYEESSAPVNQARGQRIYRIVNVVYWISLVIGIVALIGCLMNIPFGSPDAGASEDEVMAYQFVLTTCVMCGFITVFFGSIAVATFLLKRRINISYDYIFVSGELRIAKVFNVNRRKLVVRLQPEHILQVGDIDNTSYDRLKSDPSTKEVIVTPNNVASNGKFFMYVHADDGTGKKLYVLECREELLINILKFVRRGTLESDYVMQEKKQKQV